MFLICLHPSEVLGGGGGGGGGASRGIFGKFSLLSYCLRILETSTLRCCLFIALLEIDFLSLLLIIS